MFTNQEFGARRFGSGAFMATLQVLLGIFLWILLRIFTKYEVYGGENLKNFKGPYIVAANHESDFDPPLAGFTIFGANPSMLPLRYMAIDYLFYIPIFGQLIWMFGAFRTHRGKGIDRSLLVPRKILASGGGVIMFPEGHLVKERPKLGEGRRGAAVLALSTKAPIIPMSLHTPAKMTIFKFLFGRPHIVVRIGEPFYLDNTTYPDLSDENTLAATKVIMEKIGHLYYQHEY